MTSGLNLVVIELVPNGDDWTCPLWAKKETRTL